MIPSTHRRSPKTLTRRSAAAVSVRSAILVGSLVAACLLVSAGSALAAPSATLTITETSRSASASGGPFFVPNETYTASFVLGVAGQANSDSFTCDALANPCFEVQVDVALPADYAQQHPTDVIRITAGWDPQVSDLDMHVYTPPYNTASGQPFRSSRNNPPAPEVVEFPAPSGATSYRVFLVPAAPAALSATITASLVTGPTPAETEVTLGGPTFVNYTPPTSVSTRTNDAAEPTMGVDLSTNSAYMLYRFDVLETAFDDSTTPATATWRNLGTGGAPTTADPFLTMDQHRLPDGSVNRRVWIAQLLAASSYMAFNDSSGTSSTWTNSLTGPGQVHGVDNQSIAAGPYPNNVKPSTARPGADYPHALYYCSHAAANAFCSRSDDGGLTFNPSRPIFELQDACNNHGHVKVGADGTVYVPMNNSCQGHEGVSLSIDAGETWHYIQVPGTVSGRWDSSIAIASDGSTIYYGYAEEGDDRPMILKGTLDKSDPSNPTIDWQVPAIDVGAPAGLVNIAFPTVVAGDPDRAAYIFHGTTTPGNSGDMATFPANAEWYLWIATTFDGGATWELRNATPNDPTQKGSICDQGVGCDNTPNDRNLLDFMDADIDGEGRILVGYADGCVDACVTGGANGFTRRGYIARQATGRRMFAEFDPDEQGDLPGSPALTASRDPLGVNLSWTAPDSGTAPITSYTVERARNDEPFRSLATAAPTATRHNDTTAIDEEATYRYRVSAVNLHGAGPASNTVAPALPTENICVAPGLTVLREGSGDAINFVIVLGQPVGVPAPAAADLLFLAVSEPYLAGGALTLTFQLKTAAQGDTLPPDTTWFTSFRNEAGVVYAVRMVTNATGTPRFESYRVAAGSNGARRGDFVEGTPLPARAGSGYAPATGLITITVRASDIGVAAGQSINSLLSISSKLAGTDATGGFVGGSQPMDLMPDDGVGTGEVRTVPVANCGPNQAPIAVLSASPIGNRKQLNVHFDASRSFDPDATSSDPQLRDTIVKYVFDFGDGTPPVATTEPTIDHQYAQDGQYGATVRVQDSRGKASAAEAIRQICEKCLKQR
ncbi:MAG TPA: PKD domain-containing protein [Thermoanaerobaculia bacterium]